jgi:hypothetical protein
MTQRTVTILLTLLVIGVWGLLLRPVVTPQTVHAQDNGSPISSRSLLFTTSGIYLYGPNGGVYHFDYDLTPRDHALPVSDNLGNVSYTVVHQR